jgi:hypothetical protein
MLYYSHLDDVFVNFEFFLFSFCRRNMILLFVLSSPRKESVKGVAVGTLCEF